MPLYQNLTSQELREQLGQNVREIWIGWAHEQPEPKETWLRSWEELDETEKEVDRQIGEFIFRAGYQAGKLAVEDEYDIDRLMKVEDAATKLFVHVWRGILAGWIPDRCPVDDAALVLRGALNPNWPNDPDWLPEELRAEEKQAEIRK